MMWFQIKPQEDENLTKSTYCFSGSSHGKRVCLQCGRLRFDPWVENIPWRRVWLPTLVFLPGEHQPEAPGGLQSMGSQRVQND